MRFDHDDISLWYGTRYTPAPGSALQAGIEVPITVGVQPADASNKVEVLYRVNRGSKQAVPAKWWRTDAYRKTQYFRARLPAFRAGDTVEYIPICYCAGRQVPSTQETKQFPSSFRIIGGEARSTSVIAPISQRAFGRAQLRPEGGDEVEPRPKPGRDRDNGRPGPGPGPSPGPQPVPPVLTYPDIALEMLACLDTPGLPTMRDDLKDGLIDALKDAEKALKKQTINLGGYERAPISLFPNPEFHGDCFNSLEKDGIWVDGFPGSTDDWHRILQPFEFLTGKATSFFSVGVVITRALVDKAALIAKIYLGEILWSKGLSLLNIEVIFEKPNRVKTILKGHVVDAPFPFNLWPPEWTATLVETLSIEQTPVDCVPKKLLVHSDVSADVDIEPLLRIFLDLGAPIFLGFISFPGLAEIGLEYVNLRYLSTDALREELAGAKIPGIAADLCLALPSQRLLPGSCNKLIFDYQSIDVTSTKPEGIRVIANICPSVSRQPKVSVSGPPSLRIGISRLFSMRTPIVEGRYALTGVKDLRGDPDTEFQIFWQATYATVNPLALGKPTSVEVNFNLNRDRGRFQVGQQLAKDIDVAVYDLDNCLAQASLPVTIIIYDDTEPPGPDGPPKPIPPLSSNMQFR
jgi:hypothetical protein